MGRAPCCEKVGLKRGRWTAEEDEALRNYILANGEGCWRSLPKNAGLLRCGKSCRLRWINYLRSDLKRGNISPAEEDIIINLHATMGNRWSLIAAYMPGRTDNEIKNYWNSHLSRKIHSFRRVNPNFVPPPLPSDSSAVLKAAVAATKKPGDKTTPTVPSGATKKKKKNKNTSHRKNTSTTPRVAPNNITSSSSSDHDVDQQNKEVEVVQLGNDIGDGGDVEMPTTPTLTEKEALSTSTSIDINEFLWQEENNNNNNNSDYNVIINPAELSSPPEHGMGAAAETTTVNMLPINEGGEMASSGTILCLDDMMADLNRLWSMDIEDRDMQHESGGTVINMDTSKDEQMQHGAHENIGNSSKHPGSSSSSSNNIVDDFEMMMRSPAGEYWNNNINWPDAGHEEDSGLNTSSSSWLWDTTTAATHDQDIINGGGDYMIRSGFELMEDDYENESALLAWLLS